MLKILLAEPLDADAEARLSVAARVIRPRSQAEADLCAVLNDCEALIAKTTTLVSRAVLQAGRKLRVVGVAGVGLDNVDVDAARELGIAIVNTPDASTQAVAELTVALLLQMLRPIPHLSAQYRRGEFRAARAKPHGPELADLTVGILGLGRIGARVARICASGIGARVIFHDIAPVDPVVFTAQRVDAERLWRESDVLSIHVPLTALTRGLVGTRAFALMKTSSYLVNTARGAIVDTPAVVDALRDGRLAGAALDVTDPEPLPTDHELWSLPNCILTPHVGARTLGGVRRMHGIVDQVLKYLGQPAP